MHRNSYTDGDAGYRWALKHPTFLTQPWHIFVVYILIAWIACFLVCSFNRLMPYLNQLGLYAVIVGFIVTVIVVLDSTMPFVNDPR